MPKTQLCYDKSSKRTSTGSGLQKTQGLFKDSKGIANALIPTLYNPNKDDFLIVETDASEDTWAGCLMAIPDGKKLLFQSTTTSDSLDSSREKMENHLRMIHKSIRLWSLSPESNPKAPVEFFFNSASISAPSGSSESKSTKNKSHTHSEIMRLAAQMPKKLCKYTSGTFTVSQKNYTVHEKETLAILNVLEKWQLELLPEKFLIITDSS